MATAAAGRTHHHQLVNYQLIAQLTLIDDD
jgi:hypothetical protein